MEFIHNPTNGVHFAVQKMAHEVGYAYHCPHSYLSIHPVYGTWFAFRAVILIDEDIPLVKSAHLKHPCPEAGLKMIEATNALLKNPQRATWQDWLSVRDYCTIGRDKKYSEEQILYHYTGNRLILKNIVERVRKNK